MYRTKSQLIGNVSTGASFAGIITAPGLSVDTVNISGASTIANVTFSSGIITATSGVVTFYGDGSGLTGISAGSTVFDDTLTDATFYPVFTDTTSGLLSTSRVSTTNLTFNPSSSTLNVGTGITLSGSDGSISIAGTIYASSLNVPIEVSSFDPANGSTVANSVNIIITFNQTVGLGTTGFIELKQGSATGTLIETFYPSSSGIALTSGGTKLSINPTSSLPSADTIYPIMSSGFVTANGSDFTGINTVGSGVTYSFITLNAPGDAYEGGYLICQSGGTNWIVAPAATEVSRDWHSRDDAVTTANASAACGDWFVPTIGQLQNPGYTCRTYWDSYSPFRYWSSTPVGNGACNVDFSDGNSSCYMGKLNVACVRSFRCATY